MQGNISHVLSDDNISKSAGGFQWKYDNGDYSDIAPLKNNGKAVAQISSSSGKIIAKFESMAEAERKTGIDHRQIWKCCQGLHKTSGGFVWKYEEE
ncbi:NUMOD1 domain-containing DNA-binding protein [Butyrivibrio sp. INlla16]|uniref:NUMOD1 domain-containing DNA-binding protein n=1 Tax=Butyrivibrio sp. INlla16 TaxID=1520807 RepID=UPI00241C669D|nr:NUMOD1 domain-containing DNA-binding protein [Butyrivibrio sp. INlla16]